MRHPLQACHTALSSACQWGSLQLQIDQALKTPIVRVHGVRQVGRSIPGRPAPVL